VKVTLLPVGTAGAVYWMLVPLTSAVPCVGASTTTRTGVPLKVSLLVTGIVTDDPAYTNAESFTATGLWADPVTVIGTVIVFERPIPSEA